MKKYLSPYKSRINKLSFIIIAVNIFLLFVFFKIQIIDSENYQKIVVSKGWRDKTIIGKRGEILDTNGKKLAISISKYNFWVNTTKEVDKEEIAELFSSNFKKTKNYYLQKLNTK